MTLEKEFLVDLRENYEKTEVLVIEKSKLDPTTDPFKSHYEARIILLDISRAIKERMDALDPKTEDYQTLKFALLHITVDLGKIYNFTEEITMGEKYLSEALESVKDQETNAAVVCAVLSALNESGIMWMNRGETEKAKDFLIKAETYCNTFRRTKFKPLSIYDILNRNDPKSEKLLEKINVLTLFYLAQVFGSLGELERSANYCHTTLKKQLIELEEYESIDWALNAATLSQYFITNSRYTEARHHLAAATQILMDYHQDMIKPAMSDDEKKDVEETFNHRFADVNRCWVKYALNLMADSRDRLLNDSDADVKGLKISDLLTFGAKIDAAYENVITSQFLLTIDDAKPVFLTALNWIEKAKSYYTADTEASEYCKIVQDHASAYKHLAFYESNPSNQAKMHKRRVDLLEDLLKQLNKVFYMNVVREILYELGTAYSNILDIKLEAFEESQRVPNAAIATVNPNVLKKINDLITKSRSNFNEFISTYFQPGKTEELKSDLTSDELTPIAFSYFQIARISYKFITPDKNLQYKNLSTCLESYRRFVALCAKNDETGEKMKAEVGVSKEMIYLLPMKLERLKADLIESGICVPALTN